MNSSFKQKLKYFFWIIFSVTFGIFLTFSIANNISNDDFEKNLQNSYEQIQTPIKNKNQDFYFIKNPNNKLKVSAEAYFVGDLDTGELILEKNKEKQFPIASISKLFTATLASEENQNPESITIISANALNTKGGNGDLKLKEKIKTADLIYPLLLESSNDAAEAIAEFFGRNNFIEKINEKVKNLGLLMTSFEDPSGLSEKNQSTASDLFKFAQYLKTNKLELLQLTTTKSFNNKKHTWFNNSQFLDFEGYVGGKRGYIDEAKQTALSVFSIPLGKSEFRNIGIIVLRSDDRLRDIKNIYNYLRKNVYYGKESDADLAWVKQREGIVEEREPNFITLAFGGDLMLARGVRNSVMKNFGGDYSLLFENLGILKKVDIAFANLEGPASDIGKDLGNLYSFRMDPSVLPALKGAGISVVSVANNHEGDWGREAFIDTLDRLKENEIFYTGGGINSKEAEEPVIIEKYDMKIGYLAFSDKGPEWMKSNENQPGIILANNPRLSEIIKNASAKVDNLIVSFHFGEEYQTVHNERQEYLAHLAIDNGARLVINHHPHVMQDTEVYKNGFIAYSLGNFIFDQGFSKNTMEGMLLEIKLYKNGEMTTKKNVIKLTKFFQPDKLIEGKEEKIKFPEPVKIQ
ncbi:MAG: CapA family protein [Candidatus Paceibacterota bacterium]